MKKLILASNNAKKLKELKAILSDMDVDILSQREAGCNFEVDETGTTFAENAYLKAKAVFHATPPAATMQAIRKNTCIFYQSLKA